MRRKSDKKRVYKENSLKFALKFYKKSKLPLELLCHLVSTRRISSFSVITIQASDDEIHSFLKKNKRQTDLLLKIDSKRGVYILLCQETKVDGGYYFIKRLLDKNRKIDMRVSITGVESAKYEIKNMIFIVLDSFLKVKNATTQKDKIYYRTIR